MVNLFKSFGLLLVLFYLSEASACDQLIDPNRVMLFIDTNLSLKEVEVAKQGACARGERFVLYPDGALADKARRTFYNYLTKEEYYNKRCKESTPACDKLEVEVDKLKEQMDDFDFDEFKMNDENIKKVLSGVKESKASISTLIVSGHDGGGEISGDYISGAFTKNSFFSLYDEVFDSEDKKKLHSVLLWGCYTGTYSEATDWKSQFPYAKAIAGFYDSAPLATRPASADLMLDFLLKEESLYSVEDEKELKRSIQNLKSILYVQPGIMINACHDEQIYYSHFQDGDQRKTFFLTPKDAEAQCLLIQEEWNDKKGSLAAYLEGNKEIPEKIAGSELRTLYGFIRQNEKCFKDHLDVDANKVGLLLFWNGVRENFSHKYGDLMEAAQKEMDELVTEMKKSKEDFEKAADEFNTQWNLTRNGVTYWGDESLKEVEASVDAFKDVDETYKELFKLRTESKSPTISEELQKKIDENWQYQSFLRNVDKMYVQRERKIVNDKKNELQEAYNLAQDKYRSYQEFYRFSDVTLPTKDKEKYPRMDFVRSIRQMNDAFPKESFQKIKEKYPNIEKAYKKMDNLLYQLDPSCMNFLEWHQYNPNKPLPRNQCEDKE